MLRSSVSRAPGTCPPGPFAERRRHVLGWPFRRQCKVARPGLWIEFDPRQAGMRPLPLGQRRGRVGRTSPQWMRETHLAAVRDLDNPPVDRLLQSGNNWPAAGCLAQQCDTGRWRGGRQQQESASAGGQVCHAREHQFHQAGWDRQWLIDGRRRAARLERPREFHCVEGVAR